MRESLKTEWPLYYKGWEYRLYFVFDPRIPGNIEYNRRVGHCHPAYLQFFGCRKEKPWEDSTGPEYDGWVLFCDVCGEDMPLQVFRYFMDAREMIKCAIS